jgi:uncharacterized protein YwgA
MSIHEFVLLALQALGGEVKGKTKLQKTIYFLGLITGHLKDLGYRPHFYGPYSGDVANAVGMLKAIEFLDQNVVGGWSVDQFGFEVARYDYRLNDRGKIGADAVAQRNPQLWRAIQEGAAKLTAAGDVDYMTLSVAAKTYFLLGQQKGKARMQDLARLAPRFGWSVTQEQIKEAAEYLQKLGLVELCN